MSTLIERLEADVRGAEFMERDHVPVERGHLSALLKVARTLWEEGCEESGTTTERCWDHDADDWPRKEWCLRCTALEPLFREEGS